jgi:hypothetical protein
MLTAMLSQQATVQPADGAVGLQQQLRGGRGGRQQQKQTRTSRCAVADTEKVQGV